MAPLLKLGRSGGADARLDLAEAARFDYTLLEGIDYVLFTAAVSGPDRCAREFEACWRVNVTGTVHFIREALRRGCRVLFFSSDAVFGDIPGAVYDETSETRAGTPYGRMKKAVEDEFRTEPGFKAVRLSYVASAGDRFISYLLRCIEAGERAEVFHPFYRNVVTASDVADIVLYLARHWAEYEPAFLNAAGPELVSRVRMADELNRFFGDRLAYTITAPGEDFFANRPRITQMKSLYLGKYGIVEEGSFTEKLAKELKEVVL